MSCCVSFECPVQHDQQIANMAAIPGVGTVPGRFALMQTVDQRRSRRIRGSSFGRVRIRPECSTIKGFVLLNCMVGKDVGHNRPTHGCKYGVHTLSWFTFYIGPVFVFLTGTMGKETV